MKSLKLFSLTIFAALACTQAQAMMQFLRRGQPVAKRVVGAQFKPQAVRFMSTEAKQCSKATKNQCVDCDRPLNFREKIYMATMIPKGIIGGTALLALGGASLELYEKAKNWFSGNNENKNVFSSDKK